MKASLNLGRERRAGRRGDAKAEASTGFSRRIVLFGGAAALAALPGGPQAQTAFDMEQFTDFCRHAVFQVLVPRLRENVSAAEQAVIDRIEWRLPPHPAIAPPHAFIDNDRRVVEIGISFFGAQLLVTVGVLQAHYLRQSERLPAWLEHIETVAVANDSRRLQGAPLVDAPSFAIWFGLTPAQVASIPVDQNSMLSIMLSGMMFVVAHEAVHHLTGDLFRTTDTAENQQIELRADAVAISVVARAGFFPLAAEPLLIMFMSGEGRGWRSVNHPAASCRLNQLYQLELPRLRADTAFQNTLRQNPEAAAQWRRQLELAAQLAAQSCR